MIALEKKIDEMVYALYGLTPEEIALRRNLTYYGRKPKLRLQRVSTIK